MRRLRAELEALNADPASGSSSSPGRAARSAPAATSRACRAARRSRPDQVAVNGWRRQQRTAAFVSTLAQLEPDHDRRGQRPGHGPRHGCRARLRLHRRGAGGDVRRLLRQARAHPGRRQPVLPAPPDRPAADQGADLLRPNGRGGRGAAASVWPTGSPSRASCWQSTHAFAAQFTENSRPAIALMKSIVEPELRDAVRADRALRGAARRPSATPPTSTAPRSRSSSPADRRDVPRPLIGEGGQIAEGRGADRTPPLCGRRVA